MDESSNESSGEHEPRQPESAKTPAAQPAAPGNTAPQASEGDAHGSTLPVVWSPKVDAGDGIGEEPAQSDAGETVSPFAEDSAKEEPSAAATTAAASRYSRFALLAASLALAAGFGSFAGALSGSGMAHLWPPAAAKSSMAMVSGSQATKVELAELSALKANLDSAARSVNGQLAKIADRLDHVERAQSEPAAKIARIADAVDRLEKRAAPPDITGAIGSNEPAPTEPKLTDRVLPDWVVQDVRGGRALIESRYGSVFTVTAGSILPGLGRVETIKRQDGEWVVVTARGMITSSGR